MSGIAGLIRFGGAVDRDVVEQLTLAMARRGPDGSAHWVEGAVGLGQCLLSPVPGSAGPAEVASNADQSLRVVMDGRLDNRDELQAKLRAGGIRRPPANDAEYLLAAYELWGEQSPRQLLGDFAYALWDGRRHRLFCVRDPLGVKPFYYVSGSEYFAFASDEEAFLGLPGFAGAPNPKFVAASLIGQDVGDIVTEGWLRDVAKLPGGSTLVVGPSLRPRIERYWKLEPQEELRLGSDAEYGEACRTLLTEAVRCRLPAQGSPAVMLSGGIDSSSVAGLARQLLADESGCGLHTFSVVSDDAACTETPNIRRTVQGHEGDASLFSAGNLAGTIDMRDLQTAAWDNAHPIGNHILLPAMMYLAAARAGHRLMLDGVHGDAVTGTDAFYMTELLRAGRWSAAWRESRMAHENSAFLARYSPAEIFARSAWTAFAPPAVKLLKARAAGAPVDTSIRDSVINRDLAQTLGLASHLEARRALALRHQSEREPQRHLRALMPEIPWAMEGFDAVAGRYGIEPGHPWSDRRVVEFFLSLPLSQKSGQGWQKLLLRRVMEPLLDRRVVWHRSMGHLGYSLVSQLMALPGNPFDIAIDAARTCAADFVDFEAFSRLFARWRAEPGKGDMYRLFTAFSVLLWLRRIGGRKQLSG